MNRAIGSEISALFTDYRRFAGGRLWLAFALMLLGALAEGFGLLMIVPLATIALQVHGAPPLIDSWIAGWSGSQRFAAALALFVGAMIARAILLFARDVLLARLQVDYEADLKLRAASTLAVRGWPFASKLGQDGMQSLLLTDVPRAALATSYIQTAVLSATVLAVQLGLAMVLSPKLTLIALAFMALGGLAALRVFRRSARSGFAISETFERSAASGVRVHAGLKAALAQGTIHPFLEEYGSTLARAGDEVVGFARDSARTQQLAGLGGALAAAVLLLVGVQVLALPFAVLITILILFARMNGPAQLSMNTALQAVAHAPSFAVVKRRLGGIEAEQSRSGDERPVDWSELMLDGLKYEHEPGVGLPTTSLRLRRGEWLGITGPSGAGKTTLVDLVAGLLTPATGGFWVDGNLIDEAIFPRWRAGIAYAGQDGAVFNDSIRGNLLAEGSAADEQELWTALDAVGLAGRVRALPGGLDESVGERGSSLSGGERQRLLLARAILRRPTLLILDEATAALDPEAEAAVLTGLKAIEPRPAALIIAHRESTLAHCDSRLVIQHGSTRAEVPTFANETTSARVNVVGLNAGGKE